MKLFISLAATPTFFHVTPTRNLKKILANGIEPRVGVRSRKLSEVACIHLFRSRDSMEDAVMGWLGEQFGENTPLTALEIRLDPSVKHHPDPSLPDAVELVFDRISPQSILHTERL